MKNQKVSTVPRFVSREDLQYAHKLFSEFKRLSSHRMAVGGTKLKTEYRRALADYRADPSDARFAELMHADIQETHFRQNQRLRGAAHYVLSKYAEAEIIPWLKALLARGALVARESLGHVVEKEKQRTIALTGFFAESESPVVNFAKRPLQELEGTIEQLEKAESLGSGLWAIEAAKLIKCLHEYSVDEAPGPEAAS